MTVVAGRNGAGKSNLLEAIYFACTGRSCRTANERECVRFGADFMRLELRSEEELGAHELTVGFEPGEPKRFTVDGAPVERLADVAVRPLVSVFLPDRLELVRGHAGAAPRPPGPGRRGAVAVARRDAPRVARGARAAQRPRGGDPRRPRRPRASLAAWDAELARHGVALMADRAATVERVAPRFAAHAAGLGLDGEAVLPTARARRRRRPASWPPSWPSASKPTSSAASPATARTATTSRSARDGRDLRAYGSRGQQRLALLALLLAEREELADARRGRSADAARRPDVRARRGPPRAPGRGAAPRAGRALSPPPSSAWCPGADAADVARVAIVDGAVLQEDPRAAWRRWTRLARGGSAA